MSKNCLFILRLSDFQPLVHFCDCVPPIAVVFISWVFLFTALSGMFVISAWGILNGSWVLCCKFLGEWWSEIWFIVFIRLFCGLWFLWNGAGPAATSGTIKVNDALLKVDAVPVATKSVEEVRLNLGFDWETLTRANFCLEWEAHTMSSARSIHTSRQQIRQNVSMDLVANEHR